MFSEAAVQAQTVTKTIRASFEIEPVTVIQASSETGVASVKIGPVSPRATVPDRVLEVSIITNTRKRYRIDHRLKEGALSAEGSEFPPDQFLFRVTNGKEGGRSEIPSTVPVSPGEVTIFSSGPEGGSDTFQIFYSVANTRLFSAGLYYGSVDIDIQVE